MMDFIRRVRDEFGITILLIEHQMRVVMGMSDEVTVLDHGVKIAEGTPSEVKNDPKVIEAYLGSSTGARRVFRRSAANARRRSIRTGDRRWCGTFANKGNRWRFSKSTTSMSSTTISKP